MVALQTACIPRRVSTLPTLHARLILNGFVQAGAGKSFSAFNFMLNLNIDENFPHPRESLTPQAKILKLSHVSPYLALRTATVAI